MKAHIQTKSDNTILKKNRIQPPNMNIPSKYLSKSPASQRHKNRNYLDIYLKNKSPVSIQNQLKTIESTNNEISDVQSRKNPLIDHKNIKTSNLVLQDDIGKSCHDKLLNDNCYNFTPQNNEELRSDEKCSKLNNNKKQNSNTILNSVNSGSTISNMSKNKIIDNLCDYIENENLNTLNEINNEKTEKVEKIIQIRKFKNNEENSQRRKLSLADAKVGLNECLEGSSTGCQKKFNIYEENSKIIEKIKFSNLLVSTQKYEDSEEIIQKKVQNVEKNYEVEIEHDKINYEETNNLEFSHYDNLIKSYDSVEKNYLARRDVSINHTVKNDSESSNLIFKIDETYFSGSQCSSIQNKFVPFNNFIEIKENDNNLKTLNEFSLNFKNHGHNNLQESNQINYDYFSENYKESNFQITSKFVGTNSKIKNNEESRLSNNFIFEDNSDLENDRDVLFNKSEKFGKNDPLENKNLYFLLADAKDKNIIENNKKGILNNNIQVKSSIMKQIEKHNFFDNESIGSRLSENRYFKGNESNYDDENIHLNLSYRQEELPSENILKKLKNSNKYDIISEHNFIYTKCESFQLNSIEPRKRKTKSCDTTQGVYLIQFQANNNFKNFESNENEMINSNDFNKNLIQSSVDIKSSKKIEEDASTLSTIQDNIVYNKKTPVKIASKKNKLLKEMSP